MAMALNEYQAKLRARYPGWLCIRTQPFAGRLSSFPSLCSVFGLEIWRADLALLVWVQISSHLNKE